MLYLSAASAGGEITCPAFEIFCLDSYLVAAEVFEESSKPLQESLGWGWFPASSLSLALSRCRVDPFATAQRFPDVTCFFCNHQQHTRNEARFQRA